jgi:NAD(P)-dependent dehydrogenase (short-subunit alcohol dehydrogenase family)
MWDFQDKVAVVTGGLSGIGRVVAETLAHAGASVLVFDNRATSRDDDVSGDEFASSLGREARFALGDVSVETDVLRLFETVMSERGRCDVVVNSAGVRVFKPIEMISVDEFDWLMGVNVKGTFLSCRSAIHAMKQGGRGGSIVNIASNFALVGDSEMSIYSASKGAVVSLTRALAVEVGQYGIRINALCPGATATEFNREYRETRPDVLEKWREKTPLLMEGDEFLAAPHDISAAALFLASEHSRYMTGSSLVCDGGWNAA